MNHDIASSAGAWTSPVASPTVDPIARDFILLALRVSRLVPGLLESYFGPSELRAQVEAEPLSDPVALRREASTLLARVPREAREPERGRWLSAQLVALEAEATSLCGDPLPYADFVACCFNLFPAPTAEGIFANACDDLARLLPPDQATPLAERLAAWNRRFEIDPERLPAVADRLVAEFRGRTARLIGLPENETVELEFASDGQRAGVVRESARRSRVFLGRDGQQSVCDLVRVISRSAYPGHHTHRCWLERLVIEELGRLEAGLVLANTPARLMSEGWSDFGERLVAPDDELADLLVDTFSVAGLAIAADPVAARDAAERQVRIRRVLSALKTVTSNAAYMLHVEGCSRTEVLAFLQKYLIATRAAAERRLAYVEDPIWRAYAYVGFEGERLLRRWFDLGDDAQTRTRFRRLVQQQLTPRQLLDELGEAGFEQAWQ